MLARRHVARCRELHHWNPCPQKHRGRHRNYVSITSDSRVTRGGGATLPPLRCSRYKIRSAVWGLNYSYVKLCNAFMWSQNNLIIAFIFAGMLANSWLPRPVLFGILPLLYFQLWPLKTWLHGSDAPHVNFLREIGHSYRIPASVTPKHKTTWCSRTVVHLVGAQLIAFLWTFPADFNSLHVTFTSS